ncbi:DctP family TRAP transporter solute-binding subunit [Desulfosarcina sp.]|uniref:DctP family TRAP transporter solute-binding subunit n=1 Tax=Desulfosarcina sp. TaxID=2027861 RepID=UPI003970E63F
MFKKTSVLLTVLAIFFMAANVLYAAPKVIKIAHLNPQTPFDVATAAVAAVLKNELEARTGGQITVEIYPNGTLGNERETMEQVKAGITQSYIASVGGIAPFYPLIDITSMPFAYNSYEVGCALFDGSFGKELAEDIRTKTGMRVLAFIPQGFFELTNSKRPIKTPEDMKGLKIRTMNNPLHMEFMNTLGAAATPVAWAETYTALQMGVVDGQHNPITVINLGKIYEVQKYMTLSNHMGGLYVLVINDAWFNRLTPEEKTAVQGAADVAAIAGRGIDRLVTATEKGLPTIAAKMEVYTPTPEEIEKFREISIPAAKKFFASSLGEQGTQWIDKYLAAIEEAKKSLMIK